ncbi:MAG: amidohydrolase [Candidatus Acidiferrales bacterium]
MKQMKSDVPALGGIADAVLLNGNIYTGDSRRPRVEAVAIRGESIIVVGTSAELQSRMGPKTAVINLKGQFAMPGFNDAHVHLAQAGFAKLAVDLDGVKSIAEFQERIRARLREYKRGEWITGRGWDQTLWPDKQFPTRNDLDAVSKDDPMFFARLDGHVAVANTAALAMAEIAKQTPDPPGGHIGRDPATGEPTGLLGEDAAMNLVYRRIPAPRMAQRRRAIEGALADVARHGVTSLQDNSVLAITEDANARWENFLVYAELRQEGKLTARITEWLDFTLPLEKLEELRQEGGATDPWLKTGALKAYLDGSLGSRTAALLAPYADEPSTSGILRVDPEDLKRMAIERDRAGFQLAFHAIGDRANRVALDAFAAVRAANGSRDRRDRVEHAQVVAPQDFPRFAPLGVIASMQPCHLLDDERWAAARLGPQRSKGAYAWKTFEKDGVKLAFGTDYPIESVNPLRSLYACVTRELPEGGPTGGWEPQERLSMENCIRDYTVGSAFAEFEEKRKGILAPGMLADIVVLPQDITTVAPRELLEMQVTMTIVGGRVVYQKK